MKGSEVGWNQQSKGTKVNEKMKQAATMQGKKGSLAYVLGKGRTDNFRLV